MDRSKAATAKASLDDALNEPGEGHGHPDVPAADRVRWGPARSRPEGAIYPEALAPAHAHTTHASGRRRKALTLPSQLTPPPPPNPRTHCIAGGPSQCPSPGRFQGNPRAERLHVCEQRCHRPGVGVHPVAAAHLSSLFRAVGDCTSHGQHPCVPVAHRPGCWDWQGVASEWRVHGAEGRAAHPATLQCRPPRDPSPARPNPRRRRQRTAR